MAEGEKPVERHEILQLCPAPPGWFAVFREGTNGVSEQAIACWATVRRTTAWLIDDQEEPTRSDDHGVLAVGLVPYSRILMPPEELPGFLGYRGPDMSLAEFAKAHTVKPKAQPQQVPPTGG